MDHCYDSPCRNNGTCHNHLDNYTCTCLEEYSGKDCEGVSQSKLKCVLVLIYKMTAESDGYPFYLQLGIIAKVTPARTTEPATILLTAIHSCDCPAGSSGLNCEGKWTFLCFFTDDLFLSQFNELSLGILSCVYHVQNYI